MFVWLKLKEIICVAENNTYNPAVSISFQKGTPGCSLLYCTDINKGKQIEKFVVKSLRGVVHEPYLFKSFSGIAVFNRLGAREFRSQFCGFIIPHLMTYPHDLPERVSNHVDNLIASYHTLQLSDLLVGGMSVFLRFFVDRGRVMR